MLLLWCMNLTIWALEIYLHICKTYINTAKFILGELNLKIFHNIANCK